MRVSRNELARLLGVATKIVDRKGTIPILGTVRLVADGGRLSVAASNMDIEINGSIEADGDIAACVNGHMLADVVNRLAGDDITVEIDGTQLIVKAGRSRFKLPTLPVEDFPTMEAGAFDAEFDADLASVFALTQFAISSEETRYYLNGVFLEPSAATATDGHRLSTVEIGLLQFAPVIVPRQTVAVWPKGERRVSVSSTRIRVAGDDFVLTSKLIDGTFPDWRRVVPTGNGNRAIVDRASLVGAVNRVLAVADRRENGVRLDIAGDAIELSLRGDAEAADSVPAQYSGEPMALGINAKYLAEVLSVFPDGEVNIDINDNTSPLLFTSTSNNRLRAVVMPMRM